MGIDFLREQLVLCVTNEPCNRCQTERLAKAKLNTQKLAFYLHTDLQCSKFNISLIPCKFTQFLLVTTTRVFKFETETKQLSAPFASAFCQNLTVRSANLASYLLTKRTSRFLPVPAPRATVKRVTKKQKGEFFCNIAAKRVE